MADNPNSSNDDVDAGANAAPDDAPVATPSAPRKSFARRNWGKITILAILGVPALMLAVWTAGAMLYTYSDGDRAGYVQKMSRKGWLCKTWEGTLYTDIARGFRADSFNFTVRSDSIARMMDSLSGKRVSVHYKQHIGLPTSCLGDTEYFVDGVRTIPE